ncbi:MAG: 16S rRNA (guanine(966)-N(2))-methyltransferase RsmD, partial [Candidatus Neomarinimicrobiota bacterium]
MTRIISGRYGGLSLGNPKHAIRPTTGKVKSYIFNVLGSLEGCRVLDLFAGSGALGIEALSRYAVHAVFVDKDPRSVKLIRTNLQNIRVPETQYAIFCSDALRYLDRSDTRFDIIFADPPYEQRLNGNFFRLACAHLNAGGILVLEYGIHGEPDSEAWAAAREKKM